MLILTRKPGEKFYIGDDIIITIVEIKGNQIRVGIDAPKSKRIYREEIYQQILDENREAAQGSLSDELAGLESLTGVKTPATTSSGMSLMGNKLKASGVKTQGLPVTKPKQLQPDLVVKRKKPRNEHE